MVQRAACGFEAGGGIPAFSVLSQLESLTGQNVFATLVDPVHSGARCGAFYYNVTADYRQKLHLPSYVVDEQTHYLQVAFRKNANIATADINSIVALRSAVPDLIMHFDMGTDQRMQFGCINTGADILSAPLGNDTWYVITGVWKNVTDAVEKHLYVNGVLVASDVAANLPWSGSADHIMFGYDNSGGKANHGAIVYLDTLDLGDDTGSENNTRPDHRIAIVATKPNRNGTHTAWAGDYQDCDEIPTDEGATKVISGGGASDEEESFELESCLEAGIAAVDTVLAVNTWGAGIEDSGSGSTIRLLVRDDGVDYMTAWDHAPPAAWNTRFSVRYDSAMPGGGPWTQQRVNALEAGVQRLHGGGNSIYHVSTVLCEIVYLPGLAPAGVRTQGMMF